MFFKKHEFAIEPLKPFGNVKSHSRASGKLSLNLDGGMAEISSPADGVIRLRATCASEFESDFSYAVVAQPQPAPEVEVSEEGDSIIFKTSNARLLISKAPFRIEFQDESGAPYCVQVGDRNSGFRKAEPEWSMSAPTGEVYLGLGEKTGGLNKRGRKWTMRAQGVPYSTKVDPLYQVVPTMIGLKQGRAWGAFFDNTFKSYFDLGAGKHDAWTWSAQGGEINVYFIAGPRLPDVTRRYMKLVGGIPMPPRWAMGYHQSRYSYKTDAEARFIAKSFRDLDIPLDVIHLDIHYMRGYRVFTFDPKRFPSPKTLSEDMKKMGIRLVCIVDPGIKEDPNWDVWKDGLTNDVYCKSSKGGNVIKHCWPKRAGFPDFGREDVRKWWGDQHQVYVDAGISGIWNDMNEPDNWNGAVYIGDLVVPLGAYDGKDMIHTHDGKPAPHARCRNVYGYCEGQATREGLLRLRPNTRPFVISRSGYAGIGRHTIMWTGDNWSTWKHLRMTLPMLMNLGLTGQPICGSDIAGFTGNASAELFARWIQIGALYPFSRGHTMVYSKRHEPWSFGKRVEEIARRYIGLRYRLLPYIYSLVWEAHKNGDPLWRPLAYHFPDDERAADVEDQVMIGAFLMAAPVMKKGAKRRKVYLPDGKWFEYFTGKIYDGRQTVVLDAPLEHMPLFVREGAIVPMGPLIRHTGEKPLDPLTLLIHPGDASFSFWEDDGESMEYERGAWAKTAMETRRAGDSFIVNIGPREGDFPVPDRNIVARIRTDSRPNSITINGKSVSSDLWEYESGFLSVKFPHRGEEITLALPCP